MKFNDYSYQRPDLQSFKSSFQEVLNQFINAPNVEQQAKLLQEINALRVDFDTMASICSIRHSINTNDKFYETENQFFDEHYPETAELINDYYRALLTSTFRKDLETTFGNQLFVLAELSLKTFEPEILQDLKDENKEGTAYNQLKARAKIEFRGQTYNLSSISPLELDLDRNTRKEAQDAKWEFFESNATEVEGIYDRLVKLRHGMANKLGYKNYIPLGYARMRRSDYGPEQLVVFRKQI
jgi:oligoendopeptidase F